MYFVQAYGNLILKTDNFAQNELNVILNVKLFANKIGFTSKIRNKLYVTEEIKSYRVLVASALQKESDFRSRKSNQPNLFLLSFYNQKLFQIINSSFFRAEEFMLVSESSNSIIYKTAEKSLLVLFVLFYISINAEFSSELESASNSYLAATSGSLKGRKLLD